MSAHEIQVSAMHDEVLLYCNTCGKYLPEDGTTFTLAQIAEAAQRHEERQRREERES